jgi:transcriptional regulator with PAS, ATPase and Fis domain
MHRASARREQPFVSINCAALPSTLIENELFGHAKGAFTGASEARKGAVQQAEGGTLFLDEIGEIPLEFQAKLLRIIDMKTISPLGGAETLVDVRIIAASNQDLKTAVHNGAFRSDLFYRLNTMPVYLPPLRERRTDISTLVDYFLGEFISDFQRSVGLETDVYPLLEKYPWPGNVRELKSLLKRVFLLTEQSKLNATDFIPHLDDETEMSEGTLLSLEEAMTRYERQYLCQVLERAGGDKDEAARLLGLPRSTLYRRLAKYGL